MTDWIEIKALFDQAPEDWSIYADAFSRFGCPGSVQSDTPPAISAYMVALEPAEDLAQELGEELKRLGAVAVSISRVPDEDWSETWKQFFKPRRIGENLVIRPTWEEYESSPEDKVIVLDPGQAFGTGDHPTTRLCLELMQTIEFRGKDVADVGCGSGILSIGACFLGARYVDAVDIDTLSVEVSKENAALNRVEFRCVTGDGFSALEKDQYDIVISNIISAVLIKMAPDAASKTKEGGYWIVSGIIKSNWPDVKLAAEKYGFKLNETREEDEWVGASFQR